MVSLRVYLPLFITGTMYLSANASVRTLIEKLFAKNENSTLQCPTLDTVSDRNVIRCLLKCTRRNSCFGLNVYASDSGSSVSSLCYADDSGLVRMISSAIENTVYVVSDLLLATTSKHPTYL